MGLPDTGTNVPPPAALQPPSDTARSFISLARDDSATLTELSTVLDQDPHLAALLVRFASVISSSSTTPALSVRRALMKIGLESAVSLVPALSIMVRHQAGESEHGGDSEFWSCSLARAFAARSLALLHNNLDPNDLFVGALLAQIGRYECDTCPLGASVSFATRGADQAIAHEQDIVTDAIEPQDLGAPLLTSWGMPERQCALVATFVPASDSLSGPPPPVLEIALLRFADAIAESLVLQQPSHAIADIASSAGSIGLNRSECIDLYDEILQQWLCWNRIAELPVVDRSLPMRGSVDDFCRPPNHDAASTNPIKILIIDDDPLTLLILKRLLDGPAKEIMTAENGEQGLSLALQHQPQMLITDWRMPGLSGLELCKILRDADSTRHMYIIMLTGRESDDEVLEAFEAGADDYMVKPFKPKILHARIRSGERLIRSRQTIIADREIIRGYADRLAAANHTLQDLAMTDVLTGLPNRRSALTRLKEVVAESHRHHEPLSCIMLDIDHFKRINDRWGHDVGDRVLRHIAGVLTDSARGYDLVSRIGGEEFLVICTHSTLTECRQLAERLRQAVAGAVITHEDESIRVSISCGVAAWNDSMRDGEDMTKAADQALYRAKRYGRNRVTTYDDRVQRT